MPPVRRPKRIRQRHFLKEWRRLKKFTTAEMAEALLVERTTYERMEKGQTPYSQDHIENAAIKLGCTPGEVLLRNPNEHTAFWTLYDAIKNAPPAVQQRIDQAIIRALIEINSRTVAAE